MLNEITCYWEWKGVVNRNSNSVEFLNAVKTYIILHKNSLKNDLEMIIDNFPFKNKSKNILSATLDEGFVYGNSNAI